MSSVVIIRFSTNMKVLEVVSTEQLPRNMPHRYRAQSKDFILGYCLSPRGISVLLVTFYTNFSIQ